MKYILLGCTVGFSLLIFIMYQMRERIKKYKHENAALKNEIENAAARLERLREWARKEKIILEEGNEKRLELAGTPDISLADRANALFGGGVRDRQGGGDAA